MSSSQTPWITDKWFSSPWNYLPEATGEMNLPDSLQVHDVTLRDGEQQAGVEFTADEKLRIAELLDNAGIHRIEAGLPAVSPADEEAVRRIAAAGFDSEVYAFSRCMVDDVKLAIDCGVTGVVMEVPSSHHLIQKGYRWPVERALEASIEATNFAHEHGLKVTFFPIDATRAEIGEYLDMMERVATDGYVDAVALVDTFGVLSPHAVGYFVRQTRARLGVPMETHFHMDFGMGVANTILAVTEGVEVIQTTVTGLGERSGNTPTEETILALLTMYGLDTGIKTEHFTDISREVLEMAGVAQPRQPAHRRRPPVQRRVRHHRHLGPQRGRRGDRGLPVPPRARRPGRPRDRAGQGLGRRLDPGVARAQPDVRRRGRDPGDPRHRQGQVAAEEGPARQRRVRGVRPQGHQLGLPRPCGRSSRPDRGRLRLGTVRRCGIMAGRRLGADPLP